MGTIFFYPIATDKPYLLDVEIGSGVSGKVLREEIENFLGLEHTDQDYYSVAGHIIENLVWGDSHLRDGCVIQVSHQRPVAQKSSAKLTLTTVSGPDSALEFELPRGRYLLGKNKLIADISIADDSLQEVEGSLSVESKGIIWNSPSQGSLPVELDSPISIGNTTLLFTQTNKRQQPTISKLDLSPIEIDLKSPRKKWIQLMTICMPLVIGVCIALLTHLWFFMLMSLASSILMWVNTLSSRGESKKYIHTIRDASQEEFQRLSKLPGCSQRVTGYRLESSETILFLGTGRQDSAIQHRNLDERFRPVLADVPIFVLCMAGQKYHLDLPHRYLRNIILGLVSQATPFYVLEGGYDEAVQEILEILSVFPLALKLSEPDALQGEDTKSLLIISAQKYEEQSKNFISWDGPIIILGSSPKAPVDLVIKAEGRYLEKLDLADSNIQLQRIRECWLEGINQATFIRGISEHLAKINFETSKQTFTNTSHMVPAFKLPKRSVLRNNYFSRDIRVYLGQLGQDDRWACLNADGPHWLIGGTTGSGKSQLLRTILLSIALQYPAQRVSFCLIDFKGGATLGALEGLPHTVSLLTDLESQALDRALKYMMADLQKREEEFKRLKVTSYQEYLAYHQALNFIPHFPELIIAVDEFKMLVEQFPQVMERLMKVATIGRSLGIHLILATQRPQGAISQDIRANIALSICLRVASAQDSFNVLGKDIASKISADSPGFGYYAKAGEEPEPFQAPIFSGFYQENSKPSIGWFGNSTVFQRSLVTEPEFHNAIENIVQVTPQTSSYQLVPHVLPQLTDIPDYLYGKDRYFLGLSEVPELAVQQELFWLPDQDGALLLLDVPEKRLQILATLVRQACFNQQNILLITADTLLNRRLKDSSNITAFSAILGAEDLIFLEEVIDQLLLRKDPENILVIVDAVDQWGDLLLHTPRLESKLFQLIREGNRQHCQVIATASQGLRGRASQVFESFIWASQVAEKDPVKKTSKDFPQTDEKFHTVEGKLLSRAYQQKVVAATSSIICLNPEDTFSSLTVPSKLFQQLPERILLDQVAKKPVQLLGKSFYLGVKENQPLSMNLREGKIVPVLGSLASGKSSFLETLRKLNPEWSYLYLRGKQIRNLDEFQAALEKILVPQTTVLLIDDLEALPRNVQEEIAKVSTQYLSTFITCSLALKAHQSPVLSGLQGCYFGFVLQPESQDLSLFSSAILPFDLRTDGKLCPGRAVLVMGQETVAFQIPLAK